MPSDNFGENAKARDESFETLEGSDWDESQEIGESGSNDDDRTQAASVDKSDSDKEVKMTSKVVK